MPSRIMLLAAQTVPEGRVFALDFQTLSGIVIQLINGIILAADLSYILYKPVQEFMRRRTERIQSKLDDAEAMMAKANELKAEYEQKMQGIEKERAELLEAARLQAAEESSVILENAREEASQIKEQALESLAEEKKRLKEETHLYIIELATLLAEKYIMEKLDDEAQNRLLEEAIAQLEEAEWKH